MEKKILKKKTYKFETTASAYFFERRQKQKQNDKTFKI